MAIKARRSLSKNDVQSDLVNADMGHGLLGYKGLRHFYTLADPYGIYSLPVGANNSPNIQIPTNNSQKTTLTVGYGCLLARVNSLPYLI